MPMNPNTTFKQNWYGRLPHHVDLATVSEADRAILAKADTRSPNQVLTMDEARDYLIKSSKVRTDADAKAFKAAIDRLFSGSADVNLDCMDESLTGMKSEICYVQVNNKTNADLKEHKDLRAHAKNDSDAPTVRAINMTKVFNDGDFEEVTAAFKQEMSAYFDGILANDTRMGGWIISGHSNGRDMLEEYAPHRYRAKVRPREVLTQLRNENPKYKRLMDTCEKVGLLGCFLGGAKEEWAQIFPNAVIVGTKEFAPSSWSGASAELYNMASRTEELFETNWKTTADKALGETKRGMWKTELGKRGVTMRIPGQLGMAEAQKMLQMAQSAFNPRRDTIKGIMAEPENYSQQQKDQCYSICNSYLQAREQIWVLSGQPATSEVDAIKALDFVKDDLFAIRKHDTRPQLPAGVDVNLAFA